MALLAVLAALATLCGVVAVIAGALAVRRFAAQPNDDLPSFPAVTVLKPLCGDEPLLEAALASLCCQAYPDFQVVFGVQAADDPALQIVQRVRARFPGVDAAVVVGPVLHGLNRKVSNLMNMLPAARHDVLVLSDSDLHVAPDYLKRVVATLEQPGVGLVTTLCGGLPTRPGLSARLGATGISHSFLPGALMSRALGRQDGLGATMALRRATLARVGGLDSLVMHLADDNVLAQRVRRLGLTIGLAGTVPLMAVPEGGFLALWQHEMRWARTIRALAPALFATSTLQYPLFWALLSLILSGGAPWALGLSGLAWAVRIAGAGCTDRLLFQGRQPALRSAWLLPLRDVLSVAEVAGSYLGGRVVWRGHMMQADDGRSVSLPDAVAPATPAYPAPEAAIP